jgi:hypothetical protein
MVWNPLTDDGDALRLAVKLQIHIEPDPLDVVVDWEIGDETTRSIVEYGSSHAGDINAATRRAIVRAAAEIGKATGQEGKA